MHPATSGDVDNPEFVEDSALAPKPVSGDAVDDGVDQREQAVGIEVTPVTEVQRNWI